ncbi:CUB and zona pellucida-like domain-containing protein 1 [Scyliorhinus torazame]|uniref:CUB and zona pellucida-like domain-containing protein 1 n=1 Tax=Scyliorhinus torazame TaxID=75743 RepID=UPI003B5BB10A
MIETFANGTKVGHVVASVGKGSAAKPGEITCGARLKNDSGSFTSPNYPEVYPNNAQCIWYIRVANGRRITLKLDGFQLEASLQCTNDYVAIYDGASTNSPLIATVCTGSNHVFKSSSNSMTIYFRSDYMTASAGFTAYYYTLPSFQITTVEPAAARPVKCEKDSFAHPIAA